MKWIHQTRTWIGASLALTVAAGLAVFSLIGLPGCSGQESLGQSEKRGVDTPRSPQPVQVKVIRPRWEYLKPQPAHVEGYETTDIYAKVSGYLKELGPAFDPKDRKPLLERDGTPRPLDIGDRVVKGDVLAVLDIPEMEQERLQKEALVEQAKAELGQAKASRETAEALLDAARAKLEETKSLIARYEAEVAYRKLEHERYQLLDRDRAVRQGLVDEKFNQYQAAQAALQAARASLATAEANIKVEQARLARARADVTSAEARVKVAEANLEHTNELLRYATLKAPYDGILTRRFADTGDFVQSAVSGKARPLFTVVRVDRLRIVADIPEAEAGLVKIGQRATFQGSSARGQSLIGKVVRCADALDPGTRTMRTEMESDTPTGLLRPGMFGAIIIQLTDYPELPTNTLLADGEKAAVLVVKDGKARRQEIELGRNQGDRVQVMRGLSGDEQVIMDAGKNLVRDGQAVTVVP